MTSNSHKNSGQIIVMLLFMITTIFTFLLLIVNVSKVSVEAIKLQTAADSVVLAVSTFQARLLNSVSDRNFILKYPSGDKQKRYEPNDPNSYRYPGIDQVQASEGYVFGSQTIFENVIKLYARYQRQQDAFIGLYGKLIKERIGEEFKQKNDKQARITNQFFESPSLVREDIEIEYIAWIEEATGKKNAKRKSINGWIKPTDEDVGSYVKLAKQFEIWDQEFTLEASAAAYVVSDRAQMWPEPSPRYFTILIPTGDRDVLH
ncbi:Tad domain-containing protein [bacterium]